jgi:hypothetical protein
MFVVKSFKMPNFTNVKLTDMVLAYGAADGNGAQLYREQFPDRVVQFEIVYFHGATVERNRKVTSMELKEILEEVREV